MLKKKYWLVALLLVVFALILTGCTTPNTSDIETAIKPEDVQNQNVGGNQELPSLQEPSIPEENNGEMAQQALGEEGVDLPDDSPQEGPQEVYNSPVEENYTSTGATPVVLYPIDMASPTPAPALTFTYQNYSADKIGLTFEGPAGWTVDDSVDGAFTLWDPTEYGGFHAFLTITQENLQEELKRSDLQKRVKSEMEAMGPRDFNSFSPSDLADRTLFGQEGVYCNYRGVLPDGTIVRGRYHVVAIKRVLYTVHQRNAADFNSSFLDIQKQLRETLTASP